jgi:SAM-dependent methyltransferase
MGDFMAIGMIDEITGIEFGHSDEIMRLLSPSTQRHYTNEMTAEGRFGVRTLEVYLKRLESIGFCDMDDVLDCGCGIGQWTLALSLLNQHVCGCDISTERLLLAHRLAETNGISNIEYTWADMRSLPYYDGRFDAIFCYSALMWADVPKAMAEFARVLKPGGMCYVCVNDLGWYLNMPNRYQPRAEYRKMALKIAIKYLLRIDKHPMVLNRRRLEKIGRESGLSVQQYGPEGTLSQFEDHNAIPRFYTDRYKGRDTVVEAILTRT